MQESIDEGVVTVPRAKSSWSVSRKYGLIGGIFYIGINLIFHFLPEPNSLSSIEYDRGLAMAITLMLLSFFIITSIKHHRDKILNFKIDYITAFKTGFSTILFLSMVAMFFNYIYFAYIIGDEMREIENVVRTEFESNTQMNEKDNMQVSYLADIFWNPLFLASAGSVMLIILGTIISAIAAIFMKR